MSSAIPQVYDSPVFRMACQQFDLVADFLDIPASARDRLKFPKRSVSVSMPVRRDDGSVTTFMGYRV
ncbi:MAG: glutamate dehydrogenase, partial [Prosthecobacter sp.]